MALNKAKVYRKTCGYYKENRIDWCAVLNTAGANPSQNVKDCENCNFYKTREQIAADHRKYPINLDYGPTKGEIRYKELQDKYLSKYSEM